MKHNIFLFIVLGLLVLAVAACSPAAATQPPESTGAAPVSLGDFPSGKFILPDNKFEGIYFGEDGTYYAFYAGEHVVEGTYSSQGNIYTEETNNQDCPDPMSYEYTFDGANLTFQLTEQSKVDTCVNRKQSFDGITYVLESAMIPDVMIDAADFSYTGPESINAGWVRVHLTNSGAETHHVQFMRLNDGVTVAQFEEALKQGEGPALALVQEMGGVGAIAPSLSAAAVLNLPAGQYVILCFAPSSADGAPHFTKGMLKTLTVQAGSSNAREPVADLSVQLRDFSFVLPDELPAGQTTIKVTNEGPEGHEFNILRLADGKTLEDVTQFLAAPEGPPPFTPVGGMNGLAIGLSGYIEFDFQPGAYVAICHIPSPKAQGHPHFTLGMVQQFSVTETQAAQLITP